jgi:hypothetical protein
MQHLNRVVCQMTPDDEFVCNLIVDDGFYVVRTGNVGALLNDLSNKNINTVTDLGDTQEFVEELVLNEERLQNASRGELRNVPGSLYIDFADISGVETTREATEDTDSLDTMIVHTRRGSLRFVFSYAREEDIQTLRAELERHIGKAYANN